MSSSTPLAALHTRTSVLLRDYAELFKVRVNALILLTAWCGCLFACARSGQTSVSVEVLNAIIGIGLVTAGSAGLNEAIERRLDGKMRRTCLRPLVTGSMSLPHALIASIAMVITGTAYLAYACNFMTAILTISTCAVYLGVYTPLKTMAPLCTFVGAIPGAMPPVLGWVAIRGRVELPAIALFAIIFFWQFPHFHAIGLMYRDDYRRAGIRILAAVETTTDKARRVILAYSVALIPASLVPVVLGLSGKAYGVAALVLDAVLLWYGLQLQNADSERDGTLNIRARRLLRATVVYLPLLFALMILDRR